MTGSDMSIVWDDYGNKLYETGIDRAVLYVDDNPGVPWNGFVAVTESPDGGAVTSYFLDGIKYLDFVASEDYKATIEAYTYPDEFEECIGVAQVQQGLLATGQRHSTFSLTYRSKIGNDIQSENFAYRLHLITNATVNTPDRSYKTATTSNDVGTLSWNMVAVPEIVPGVKPTAHLIFDSRYTDSTTLEAIEKLLYGTSEIESYMPAVADLINLISVDGVLTIQDNGDGTWTAVGPNSFITMLDDHTFQIIDDSITYSDPNTYTISSA